MRKSDEMYEERHQGGAPQERLSVARKRNGQVGDRVDPLVGGVVRCNMELVEARRRRDGGN